MDSCLWYRVQVDEDNEFYAGPITSDNESNDSNGIIHFITIEAIRSTSIYFLFFHLFWAFMFFSVLS